jgi:hypothetical protein
MRLLIGGIIIATLNFSGCTTLPDRPQQERFKIADTAYANGGTSERTAMLQRSLRTKGGAQSFADVQAVKVSQTVDLTAVMQECKARLESISEVRKKSNEIALKISMVGLVAGAIIGPTLAAASASKASIALFSSIAGAANPAQDAFKERGFDSQALAQRMNDLNQVISSRFVEFQKAKDDDERQAVLLALTADCLAKE